MCGIIGAKVKRPQGYQVLSRAIETLNIRGTHAYGIVSLINGKYDLYKTFDLDQIQEYLKIVCVPSAKILFHNRYSTSGNYDDMDNNLPQGDEKLGYISFNGVLEQSDSSNWHRLYDIDASNDNDVQILLKLMEQGHSILDLLKRYPNWSLAACMLTPDKLLGFRNNKRPLYHYQDGDLEMFISAVDPIARISPSLVKNLTMIESFKIQEII